MSEIQTPPLVYHPERQPDIRTSGATCVRMLAGALLNASGQAQAGQARLSALYVREIMDTQGDCQGMADGLTAFGMDWQCHTRRDDTTLALSSLVEHMDQGDAAILLGRRDGQPHWILATGSYLDGLAVVDPRTGEQAAWSLEEVEGFMDSGGAEFWTVPATSPCRDLRVKMLDDPRRWTGAVALLTASSAAPFIDENETTAWIRSQGDPASSIGLYDGGRLLGAVAMRQVAPISACRMDDVIAGPDVLALSEHIGGERAVWAVTMAVTPELKGLGYERLLRAMPGELGCRWCYSFGRAGMTFANWQGATRTARCGNGSGRMIVAGRVDTVRPVSSLDIADDDEPDAQPSSPSITP